MFHKAINDPCTFSKQGLKTIMIDGFFVRSDVIDVAEKPKKKKNFREFLFLKKKNFLAFSTLLTTEDSLNNKSEMKIYNDIYVLKYCHMTNGNWIRIGYFSYHEYLMAINNSAGKGHKF